jgi:uncharacterized protein (DUF1778 family)
MAKSQPSRSRKTTRGSTAPDMVHLDAESRECVARAAELRRVSVSDYVRVVALAQARRDVHATSNQRIHLSPDEQVAFWNALRHAPELTSAQRQLAAIMRACR